jgi:hypothetical protein
MLYNQWYVGGNNSGGGYSNRVLFTESRNSLDMGSVQWWTSDVWNHFAWYGWTRPIWTPDACYSQPLYSPNCSNFQDEIKRIAAELQKLQQASISSVTTSSTAPTPTGSVTVNIADAVSTNPTVTVTTESAALKTQSQSADSGSTELALDLISRNQKRETAIAMQASRDAVDLAAGSAVAGQQQAAGIAQTAATQSQSVGGSESSATTQTSRTEAAVNVAAVRIGTASRSTDTAVNMPEPGSTSVVTQAIQTGTANQATQTSSLAYTASTSTVAIVQFNAMTESAAQPAPVLPLLPPQPAPSTTTTVSAPMYVPVQTDAADAKLSENNSQQEQFITKSEVQIAIVQPPNVQSTEPVATASMSAITVTPPVFAVDVATPSTNFTTDRTNPINEIVENRTMPVEPERTSTQTTAVKSNVQDNEAAAGAPTIAAIAVVPVGFSVYSVALADAAFYAPKEIYRNQRTVDNLRALRQLSSDSLHQEMVDQQYRR